MGTPLFLSERSLRDARLYTGVADPVDSLERLVDSYGALLAEVRQLRRRVAGLEDEFDQLDLLQKRLCAIATEILAL